MVCVAEQTQLSLTEKNWLRRAQVELAMMDKNPSDSVWNDFLKTCFTWSSALNEMYLEFIDNPEKAVFTV